MAMTMVERYGVSYYLSLPSTYIGMYVARTGWHT